MLLRAELGSELLRMLNSLWTPLLRFCASMNLSCAYLWFKAQWGFPRWAMNICMKGSQPGFCIQVNWTFSDPDNFLYTWCPIHRGGQVYLHNHGKQPQQCSPKNWTKACERRLNHISFSTSWFSVFGTSKNPTTESDWGTNKDFQKAAPGACAFMLSLTQVPSPLFAPAKCWMLTSTTLHHIIWQLYKYEPLWV